MNLRVLDPQRVPGTSAAGSMRSASSHWVLFWRDLWNPGTAARAFTLEDWVGALEDLQLTGTRASTAGQPVSDATEARTALSELRRLSGLTWEQLARVFDVSRRTLHFWASGKPLNAANEERLRRVFALLRRADRGSAQANRAMLLTDQGGTVPIDLLAAGRYDEFLQLVGAGRGPQTLVRKPLSSEAREARTPLPPEELIDALQDRVHRDVGRGRAARTVRSKRRGPKR